MVLGWCHGPAGRCKDRWWWGRASLGRLGRGGSLWGGRWSLGWLAGRLSLGLRWSWSMGWQVGWVVGRWWSVVVVLWAGRHWVRAEESAVPGCRTPIAVHCHHVLVVLEDPRDRARFIPFGGVSSSLILD